GSRRTPIFVELWRFNGTRPGVDLIIPRGAETNPAIRAHELLVSLERGYVVILLDGSGGVAADLRREGFSQILTLSQRYPRCHLVLTSRPLPSLPAGFHTLAIAPLRDEDIVASIAGQFPSTRAFRAQFDTMTPSDYVRLRLKPAVRQLCRRPLT